MNEQDIIYEFLNIYPEQIPVLMLSKQNYEFVEANMARHNLIFYKIGESWYRIQMEKQIFE